VEYHHGRRPTAVSFLCVSQRRWLGLVDSGVVFLLGVMSPVGSTDVGTAAVVEGARALANIVAFVVVGGGGGGGGAWDGFL